MVGAWITIGVLILCIIIYYIVRYYSIQKNGYWIDPFEPEW